MRASDSRAIRGHVCSGCAHNAEGITAQHVYGGFEVKKVRRCDCKEKWGKVPHRLLPSNAFRCDYRRMKR